MTDLLFLNHVHINGHQKKRGDETVTINSNQSEDTVALPKAELRCSPPSSCFILDPFDSNTRYRKIVYQDPKIPQMAIVLHTVFC